MADPIMMTTQEKVLGHIDGFFSADDPPKPARVDGPPVWESSDTNAVTLMVSADGMDVEVVSADIPEGDPARVATVTMTADASLDPSVHAPIVVTQDFVVTAMPAPVAATASISFGSPIPK